LDWKVRPLFASGKVTADVVNPNELPIQIATGAAQLARRNVGTPVFGGMMLASLIGIFAIPPLDVSFQCLRERFRPAARPQIGRPQSGSGRIEIIDA
jgi:hypothetical protein